MKIFQNVFPFVNHVKLQFTVLILLTKFIISLVLSYNSFRILYVVTSDKDIQTSSHCTSLNKCIPKICADTPIVSNLVYKLRITL